MTKERFDAEKKANRVDAVRRRTLFAMRMIGMAPRGRDMHQPGDRHVVAGRAHVVKQNGEWRRTRG